MLFVACSLSPKKFSDWPVDIPSQTHYEEIYKNDTDNQAVQTKTEYLGWVVHFYQGYSGISGWHEITEQVLASTEISRSNIIAEKMQQLGQAISSEWAKLSPNRVIVNRSVSVWSEVVKEASKRNEVEALIDTIAIDIDALFARKIKPDVIQFNRYYKKTATSEWDEF